MTVEEAADMFKAVPPIRDKMETLKRVGPRLHQGRPAGDHPLRRRGAAGEALQGAVAPRDRATLYILDEPTTGLHFEDTRKLLEVLHELVDHGNTVVVIEHNLDVVKTADWIIDFGPEGGDGGGEIIAIGTPEDVAADPDSWTGRYLAESSPATPAAPRRPGRGCCSGPSRGSTRAAAPARTASPTAAPRPRTG